MQDIIQSCTELSWVDAASLYAQADPGFGLLRVENSHCRALLALQGAQVLQFAPLAGPELLWLSPAAQFRPGLPIRGGIPVCLPWFGRHHQYPQYPKHGFARVLPWQLLGADTDAMGVTRLQLQLAQFRQQPHAQFGWSFSARLTLQFGPQLQLQLQVQNLSQQPMPLSWALHSYFRVADVAQVAVDGLDGVAYLDNARGLQRGRQQGLVMPRAEFDRVYLAVPEQQQISDGSVQIRVEADNAPTAIVWNPGFELAQTMADIGPAYEQFICLERGVAFDNAVSLAPQQICCARVRACIQTV